MNRRQGITRQGITRLGVLAVGSALVLTACAPTTSTAPTKDLEIVSWWTSGSEKQAFAVFTDAFKKAHPDVKLNEAAVSGGGGGNARVVLAERLISGNPPDVFQTFPGGALTAYEAANQVTDVSDVYDDAMKKNLPPVILEGLTVNGKQYGVPTGSHRGNVLFYNKSALAKAGIGAPGATLDEWLADLDKLKAANVTPLCLGAKDAFTTPALFENILLSVVGEAGWKAIQQDRFDWGSAQVRQSLDAFGKALKNADPESAALSWDAAAAKLAQGGCAYLTMNDSAYGELLKDGAKPDVDFGAVAFPGTDNAYVAVVDTFVVAAGAKNGANAKEFVKSLADPKTQVTFGEIKGSVPVRLDADISELPSYEQQAVNALRSKPILWSIVHGSAMSPLFQQGFYDGVSTYVSSHDAATFTKTLVAAVSAQPPQR